MKRYYVIDETGHAVRWFYTQQEAQRLAAWENGWTVQYRRQVKPSPESLVGAAPF